MTTLEVLRGMRELLSDPKRWTRGCNARDNDGKEVPVEEFGASAACFCLFGAAWVCSHGKYETVLRTLDRFTKNNTINWNDEPAREHREILELLDRAITSEAKREDGAT